LILEPFAFVFSAPVIFLIHFFNDLFDRLAGTTDLRRQITEGKSEQEIRLGWQGPLEKFKEIRKKYLLYPE